jgi:hypothetical protein
MKLRITIKMQLDTVILSVVILIVVMLRVDNKPVMLSVFMLNVFMMNVVAPFASSFFNFIKFLLASLFFLGFLTHAYICL